MQKSDIHSSGEEERKPEQKYHSKCTAVAQKNEKKKIAVFRPFDNLSHKSHMVYLSSFDLCIAYISINVQERCWANLKKKKEQLISLTLLLNLLWCDWNICQRCCIINHSPQTLIEKLKIEKKKLLYFLSTKSTSFKSDFKPEYLSDNSLTLSNQSFMYSGTQGGVKIYMDHDTKVLTCCFAITVFMRISLASPPSPLALFEPF